jgi:ATP-binding cassette, subfamily B, heavy metal transporter
VREVTIDSLHRAIGVVPQDTVLFNDSILLQHRLWQGRRDAGRGRGGGKGGAHPRLHRDPARGLRHPGRRARAEAVGRREAARGDRAYAAEEPAILLLDEATSALDTQTERDIQESLRAMGRGAR